MKIEIIDVENILYPVTDSSYITGYKNHSLKQILDSYKNSINKCEVVNENIYICDKANIKVLNIKDILKFYNNNCIINVYHNGTLLHKDRDYRINNFEIELLLPTRVNDTFVFKVINNIKDINYNTKDNSSEFNEKTLIRNIFSRINTYAKSIEGGEINER